MAIVGQFAWVSRLTSGVPLGARGFALAVEAAAEGLGRPEGDAPADRGEEAREESCQVRAVNKAQGRIGTLEIPIVAYGKRMAPARGCTLGPVGLKEADAAAVPNSLSRCWPVSTPGGLI
jgi:hypothetical protein